MQDLRRLLLREREDSLLTGRQGCEKRKHPRQISTGLRCTTTTTYNAKTETKQKQKLTWRQEAERRTDRRQQRRARELGRQRTGAAAGERLREASVSTGAKEASARAAEAPPSAITAAKETEQTVLLRTQALYDVKSGCQGHSRMQTWFRRRSIPSG
jgi:hypothetical protein